MMNFFGAGGGGGGVLFAGADGGGSAAGWLLAVIWFWFESPEFSDARAAPELRDLRDVFPALGLTFATGADASTGAASGAAAGVDPAADWVPTSRLLMTVFTPGIDAA